MMNVYEKLSKCRVELQKMELKKSGHNKHSGFKYYELCDFLPQINELFDKHKLCSFIGFNEINSTLTIINSEKPDEKIDFSIRKADAKVHNASPIQQEGAAITYSRRYLYMNALEITENDALDRDIGKENKKPPYESKLKSSTASSKGIISSAQVTRLQAIASSSKVTPDEAKEILTKYKYTSSKDIKSSDYNNIIADIEELGKLKKGE